MTGGPRVPGPDERLPMVGWFDPGQLLDTGLRTVVSTLFGKNADRRVLDALVNVHPQPCDYSDQQELWIDYVSDTGDGWNSTYGVAYHLARPKLAVADPDGTSHDTRRGRVLVFGGDEVYPTPSREEYARRLVTPYQTALAAPAGERPAVFAVPGNHDWYDSLVSFTRLFCTTRDRDFGGWVARQTRSYFAVKLPHGWWLVGTDVQLTSDIDDPQFEYFRRVEEQMADGDRVILCTAEPHWIYEARYAEMDPTISGSNLDRLEHDVFKGRIRVYLAGDLHHYRRHEASDGRQKITAGGGGAYVSPTHHDLDEVATLHEGFAYRCAYPSPETSKRLSWRNLAFLRFNPKFGVVTAVLYLLLGWSVQATDVGGYGIGEFWTVLGIVGAKAIASQTAVIWALIVWGGFVYFTDTSSKLQKRLGGSLHALANLFAAFLSGWAGSYFVDHVVPTWSTTAQLVVVGGFLLAGGYLFGSVIMGLYLLISLNGFGRHNTEAFSSLRIEDYRSWLRLRVAPDGALHVYPIKIETVAKDWAPGQTTPREDGETRGLLEPSDAEATEPALIEPPIVVRPGGVEPPPAVGADDAAYRAPTRGTAVA